MGVKKFKPGATPYQGAEKLAGNLERAKKAIVQASVSVRQAKALINESQKNVARAKTTIDKNKNCA